MGGPSWMLSLGVYRPTDKRLVGIGTGYNCRLMLTHSLC